MNKFNGWKNYETWNVSLWIQNEEALLRPTVRFMKTYHGRKPYRDLIAHLWLNQHRTPDGVKFLSKKLSYTELNDMLREIA